jgi:hypothetical protein
MDMEAAPENLSLVEDAITGLFSRPWYPEAYGVMLASGNIDLSVLDPTQGFRVDRKSMTAHIKTPDFSGDFPFKGISQGASSSYAFDGTPIIITPRGDDTLIVSFMQNRNLPVSYNFVTLAKDPDDVIREEKLRRQLIYDSFVRMGPRFGSDQYGIITFVGTAAMTVEWSGINRPAFVGGQAGARGLVSFKYFLSDRMRTIYDGVITFTFADSLEGLPRESNFFYHVLGNTIQLEAAGNSAPPDNIFTDRSADPVVMLFTPKIAESRESSGDKAGNGGIIEDSNSDSDPNGDDYVSAEET